MRKKMVWIAAAALALAAALQFVQPRRANPPVNRAASFEAVAAPSAPAAAVIGRACKDCHSYETVWPWYSKISPVSWMVASDVEEGRARLNLSEWNRYSPEMSTLRMKAMCGAMRSGEMPMWQYKLMHVGARLTAGDIAAVCGAAGL